MKMLSVALPYCAMNERKNEVFIMSRAGGDGGGGRGGALAKLELKVTKSTALVARYKVSIMSVSYLYRLFPTFSNRQQSPQK